MKAYFNNGMGYRHINDASEAEAGEQVFEDIVSPEELMVVFPGYESAASAQARAEQRSAIVTQLAALDADMPRVFEDIIISGQCDLAKLPQAAQDRFHQKQTLRAEMATTS